MSEVHVKEGESLDSALKRFKRSCAKAGVLAEVRRRECYESPSVKRRKKSEAARKNITTGIAVAHARGVILYTAQRMHLPVYEYTPMQIKQAVVGYGLADKHQVMDMTRRLLKLKAVPRPDDAADALAIAICHARSATSLLRRKDPDVKETV